MCKEAYGRISKVADGSPAAEIGLHVGDELLSVNSRPVRDILDFEFHAAEELVMLVVRRDGQRYVCYILKAAEEDMGLEFEEELFDGVRNCRNNCIFCFLHQMPSGLRPSLYVRDDDYRLSFAHGNYITLTNLGDEDMDRICSQKMSPLYVSVHTTDTELRVRMMRNRNAAEVMDQLRRLAEARITIHAQIVLCPGVNDGEHLERTVRDLASLYPSVASIAIVPVGLTKHREKLTPLVSADSDVARRVVHTCGVWQREFGRHLGTRLVYPSDEFYILAGTDLPSSRAYEGFPQLEDGIGVSRIFLDELRDLRRRGSSGSIRRGRYVLVTGTLARDVVQQLADYLGEHDGVDAAVRAVKNSFLGETVTVAGLLSGRDIAYALRGTDPDMEVLVPGVALNGDRFLDDMTVEELQSEIGARVSVVPASPEAVVEALSRDEEKACAVSCAARAGTLAREVRSCRIPSSQS